MAPNRKSAKDTLSQIRDAKAWMSLLNVQTDDVYRTLVDEVLEQLPSRDREARSRPVLSRGLDLRHFAQHHHAVPHRQGTQLHPADPRLQAAVRVGSP